jgi:hypothetical protein
MGFHSRHHVLDSIPPSVRARTSTTLRPTTRVPPGKGRPTTDYAADLVDHLHDIHNYVRQHLKVASDRMKTRYDKLVNSAGYQEGDRVWLYRPTRTKGKSPKLQSSWKGPYKIVTRINDVVYRIQKYPRSRMMVVHLDRLAPYQGCAWGSAHKEGAVAMGGEWSRNPKKTNKRKKKWRCKHSHPKKRNGDTPLGYSGRTAVRRLSHRISRF